MTELNEMPAGEALDRLVAEKVMGERLPQAWADPSAGGSHGDLGGYRTGVKSYSTEMRFAWEVAERVALTYQIKVGSDKTAFAWWCEIGDGDWRSTGQKTAALAICKAAVKTFSGDGFDEFVERARGLGVTFTEPADERGNEK